LKIVAKQSRQAGGAQKTRPRRLAKAKRESLAWIRQLAAPYLKGYRPVAAKNGGLRGYWFIASAKPQREKRSTGAGHPPITGPAAGFFVGYLESAGNFSYLSPQPPECLVFAWIQPVGSALHRKLVAQQGSLVRGIFEYIRWLTHRPPRFEFQEAELPALARHQSMRDWPAARRQHLSRNFYIETLAWLVRGGLVRKLGKEAR
jgi:hypothetical protein